jgi:hypothetical protein
VTYGKRCIREMLSRYKENGSEKMHRNVFTIEINGISWDQLEISERNNRVGKNKLSTKAISS